MKLRHWSNAAADVVVADPRGAILSGWYEVMLEEGDEPIRVLIGEVALSKDGGPILLEDFEKGFMFAREQDERDLAKPGDARPTNKRKDLVAKPRFGP